MDKESILNALTPELIEKFRTAIEIGKWEDGNKLNAEQKETCMQAVLVWEHEFVNVKERTGYIGKPIKKDGTIVGEECDVEHEHYYPNNPNSTIGSLKDKTLTDETQPVSFRK